MDVRKGMKPVTYDPLLIPRVKQVRVRVRMLAFDLWSFGRSSRRALNATQLEVMSQ